jgi:hypothetical protein
MDHNEIERKVSQSGDELTELKVLVRQLQARVERHALVIQVLRDMLLAGNAASEDEFLDRLEQAAAQKADGKACRKCGKAMSAKHKRCIYCGEARPADLLYGVVNRRYRTNRYSEPNQAQHEPVAALDAWLRSGRSSGGSKRQGRTSR